MQVDVASAFDLDSQFPADACEHRVRDVAQAAEALRERAGLLFAVMQEVRAVYLSTFGEEWRPLLEESSGCAGAEFCAHGLAPRQLGP